MPNIVWARTESIQNAYDPIPAVQKPSGKDLRQPPTLKSDYIRMLEHEITNINRTFE